MAINIPWAVPENAEPNKTKRAKTNYLPYGYVLQNKEDKIKQNENGTVLPVRVTNRVGVLLCRQPVWPRTSNCS